MWMLLMLNFSNPGNLTLRWIWLQPDDDDNLSLTKVLAIEHSDLMMIMLFLMILMMMMPKVLAERIEQNLEGMSKQLSREVFSLEEVQKLQQVTMMMLKMVVLVTKRRMTMSKQLAKEVVLTPTHP